MVPDHLHLLKNTEFWNNLKQEPSKTESVLYRYEQGGIIVYDSKARLSSEAPIVSSYPELPKKRLKGNEWASECGDFHIDKHMYASMRSYPPKKPVVQEYTLVTPTKKTLKFNSHFESGNLHKAIKMSETEYNLLLEADRETSNFTQWYYFSVSNYAAPLTVRFAITNLTKYESLYNNGLQPLVFSSVDQQWKREGSEISYFKNSILRSAPSAKNIQFYYSLTFTYTFEHPNDTVFFAHCYPYTYSDLRSYIEQFRCAYYESILQINPLCRTLAGNMCPLLTVTQDAELFSWAEISSKFAKSAAARKMSRLRKMKEQAKQKYIDRVRGKNRDSLLRKKKVVFLTARVHPGESNSSYMMKGAIDFLTGESKEARMLRKHCVFHIVPMLNPDGVVYGNYRCSLLGVDLNRRWKSPHSLLHPTIYHTKKLVQFCHEDDEEILMFCDMHGHSIKKDSFIYACAGKKNEDKKSNLLIKMIPFYLSRTNPVFSFNSSHFRIERYKETTARVVMYQEFGILNSYTLESSFYGSRNFHFEIEHLESLGRDILGQLFMFIYPSMYRKKLNFIINCFSPKLEKKEEETAEESLVEYEDFTIKNAIDIIEESKIEDLEFCDENSDSCGSDSCASDNYDFKFRFVEKSNPKVEKPAKESNSQESLNKTIDSGVVSKKYNPIYKQNLTPKKVEKKKETNEERSVSVLDRLSSHRMLKKHKELFFSSTKSPGVLMKNPVRVNYQPYQPPLFIRTKIDNRHHKARATPGFLIKNESRRPYYN